MSQSKKYGFKTYTSIEPSPEMLAKIESIIEKYCDRNLEKVVKKEVKKKLKEIVEECLEEKEKIVQEQIIELRKIPRKKALTQVKNYVNKNPGCRTSDIIYDLALDPDLVLKALNDLEKQRVVRGERVESKSE